MERHHLMSGGRYPVLRTIGIFYLIGGAVACLVGLFWAAWALLGPAYSWLGMSQGMPVGQRLMLCLGILAGTFFAALGMFAVAEIIKLFIDMSNSMRMMAWSLPGAVTKEETVVTPEGTATMVTQTTHRNRLSFLDDETAEAALIRGH